MTGLIEGWVVVNAVGFAAGVYGVWDAWLDIRALNGHRNGRRQIAYAGMRTQVLRTVQLGLLTAVGLLNLFGVPVEVRRPWTIVCLMATAVLMASSSVLDRVVKRRLLADRHDRDVD